MPNKRRRKKGRKGFLYRRKVNHKRKWGKIGHPRSAKRRKWLKRIRRKRRRR